MLARQGPDLRREFFYWTDDGNFAGLRYDQYKAVFMEQPTHGLEFWIQPLVPLRAPKLFNLRSDPFERTEEEAGDYGRGGNSWNIARYCPTIACAGTSTKMCD